MSLTAEQKYNIYLCGASLEDGSPCSAANASCSNCLTTMPDGSSCFDPERDVIPDLPSGKAF
jgi:hypothetical protein